MVSIGTIESSALGSYNFRQELGRGAYGSVWRARTSTGAQVAIKIYHKLTPDVVTDLDQELNALKQISADNIICSKYAVCLLDFYYVNNAPRIVMEYIYGETLKKYRQRFTREQRQARDDILRTLICGLNLLHGLGVDHQDIKEDNIMWNTRSTMPRYVDWGLACLRQYCEYRPACEPPCGASGNAYTYPPEMTYGIANEVNFDMVKAHDIWSLGVILLDWYTLHQDQYDRGELLSTKSEKEIQEIINTIDNQLAKRVLPLLLKRDWQERLEGWNTIMKNLWSASDFLLSNNVLFIKCTVLSCYPKITQRLQELNGKCNFTFSCCAIYADTPDCNSFIVMYIDDRRLQEYQQQVAAGTQAPLTMEETLQSLEDNPGIIKSMLISIITENIIELYAVCTDPDDEGRGMMKAIFDAIVTRTAKDRLWLGIKLDNPMWDRVLRFYARAGFGKAALTRNSGGVLKALPMTVLGLSWTRGKVVNAEAVINRANYLRQQYLRAVNACSTRLHAGLELCNALKSLLDYPEEHAGVLVNSGYLRGPDNFVYVNLASPAASLVKGSGAPDFSVDPPTKPITFHVHPNMCYKYYGCYVGWPSNNDMAWMLWKYPDGVLKHYVITKEGIYSIQLSLDTQLLLTAYPGHTDELGNAVRDRYVKVLGFRSEMIPPSLRELQVDNFIAFINSYTMRDLVRDAGLRPHVPLELDFTIYTLSFFHWMDIEKKHGFLDCLIAINCHLTVEKHLDKVIGEDPATVVWPDPDPTIGEPLIKC